MNNVKAAKSVNSATYPGAYFNPMPALDHDTTKTKASKAGLNALENSESTWSRIKRFLTPWSPANKVESSSSSSSSMNSDLRSSSPSVKIESESASPFFRPDSTVSSLPIRRELAKQTSLNDVDQSEKVDVQLPNIVEAKRIRDEQVDTSEDAQLSTRKRRAIDLSRPIADFCILSTRNHEMRLEAKANEIRKNNESQHKLHKMLTTLASLPDNPKSSDQKLQAELFSEEARGQGVEWSAKLWKTKAEKEHLADNIRLLITEKQSVHQTDQTNYTRISQLMNQIISMCNRLKKIYSDSLLQPARKIAG